MKWLYSKVIKPEVLRWKKNWKGALVFLILVCGFSAISGIKTDDVLMVVVGTLCAFAIIIIALNLIFRDKE